MRTLCWMAALTTAAHAANPAAYIGAQACRDCHSSEFASQSVSAHAGALSRVSGRQGFPLEFKLSRSPRYQYEILSQYGGLRVRIDDGRNVMDLPLEWAFGAGRQAVTFVTRVNHEWYVEHYATWYAATKSYGPTPGQADLHPKAMLEAAGVLYRISDAKSGIKGCFKCHSTGPVGFAANGDAEVHEFGVRCEACHGPGGDHASHPRGNKLTNPAKLSPAAMNDFCGKCHRPPATAGVSIDWNYAWNVRHQPVYLSQSRCFLKSGTLSCLTCHSPHESAGRTPVALFNQKCMECHSGCSVKTRTNCIDCHMPLVSPQPPLRFTNHWIGIYRTGARLRPER